MISIIASCVLYINARTVLNTPYKIASRTTLYPKSIQISKLRTGWIPKKCCNTTVLFKTQHMV